MYAAEEAGCYQRFSVNDCLLEARERRRAALAESHRVRRAISLPEDADPAQITAQYRDGVLHVSVARKQAAQKLVNIFDGLPDAHEMAAVAVAGSAKVVEPR